MPKADTREIGFAIKDEQFYEGPITRLKTGIIVGDTSDHSAYTHIFDASRIVIGTTTEVDKKGKNMRGYGEGHRRGRYGRSGGEFFVIRDNKLTRTTTPTADEMANGYALVIRDNS